jgi:hypothetical protein
MALRCLPTFTTEEEYTHSGERAANLASVRARAIDRDHLFATAGEPAPRVRHSCELVKPDPLVVRIRGYRIAKCGPSALDQNKRGGSTPCLRLVISDQDGPIDP